jgi:CheY-like chemotaxis protein
MIDVLLTNVELQGMNGFDLANAIRSEFPSMPIIFMAAAFLEDAVSQSAPGCGFVPKPFDPPALIAALRSLKGAGKKAGEAGALTRHLLD